LEFSVIKRHKYLRASAYCIVWAGMLICAGAASASAGRLNYGHRFVGTTWSGFDSPLFGTVFTQITPENAGKWGSVEPRRGKFYWGALNAMYRLAARKHLLVKQHNMIWGEQQPRWVNVHNAAAAVRAWYAAYAAHYNGKFQFIDVVNEPLHHPPAYKKGLPGGNTKWGWVIWAYQLARKDFPHAKLLINDYNILGYPKETVKYIHLIRLLQARHLIDGIGCQAHGLEHIKASVIRYDLRKLNSLEIPIYISEYDLNWKSDRKQLRQMKTQFPIFWNDPRVRGVTFWDFKQGHTWLPNTYLIRRNGTPRPAFVWLRNFLRNRGR
jgi:endo-1,4-beta-xylanase